MTTQVSFNEAANLIATCGTTNTFVLQGEPGIGKSALLPFVSRAVNATPSGSVTPFASRYIDCALLDLGDLQMPKVTDSVEFVPNKMFCGDQPLIVMLDEIGKAMRPVQNALLTLLLEHRIGSHHLPKGSIVFGTTNLATDGVGDKIEAHAKNRVTILQMRKPDADEWLAWGINNDIEPEVMAWVKEYPHCLNAYAEDDANDNPYIFNPRKQQAAFVSPRSLHHASHIVKQRKAIGDDVLITALSGTVGESAARDMQAFLSVADSLTPFKVCVDKPQHADLPDSPVAAVIMVLGAVTRVTHENINSWMEYLERLPREAQFLFASNAMRSKAAATVATSAGFTQWAVDNSWAV